MSRTWLWNWNMFFFNKRYQVCRPVLVLVLVFVTWTCARDVIAEEIFVTSILQPQSWIQINWTWLCVLHIRSLLDSRWIDTYFILGDKKIAVDLNSIRCSLEISEAKPGQPARHKDYKYKETSIRIIIDKDFWLKRWDLPNHFSGHICPIS